VRVIAEQEGHVEDAHLGHEIAHRAGGGEGAVHRADLHALDDLALVVVALDDDAEPVVRQALKRLLERQRARAGVAVGRERMLDGDLRLRHGGRGQQRDEAGNERRAAKHGHFSGPPFGQPGIRHLPRRAQSVASRIGGGPRLAHDRPGRDSAWAFVATS
jgi:hypothetical protein